eukprot:7266462-Pyramimonas_sp.AAC.2
MATFSVVRKASRAQTAMVSQQCRKHQVDCYVLSLGLKRPREGKASKLIVSEPSKHTCMECNSDR